jgi:hypothetical protein
MITWFWHKIGYDDRHAAQLRWLMARWFGVRDRATWDAGSRGSAQTRGSRGGAFLGRSVGLLGPGDGSLVYHPK